MCLGNAEKRDCKDFFAQALFAFAVLSPFDICLRPRHMKREGLFEGPAKKRAAVVRLNVGGAHFDVAPETLAAATFFQAGLAGDIPMAVDENGRFFIDRSGKLFEIVVEHMRNPHLRPSQKVLDESGAALLAECEFFGYEELAQVCRGELLPGDLRPECRSVRLVEEEARKDPGAFEKQLLFDVHREDVSAMPREELQIPILLGGQSCPQLRGSFEEFKARLDKWSGGLLQDLQVMPGLVFAGGAVLGALTGCSAGDIDIFLRCTKDCTKDAEAEACLRHVFRAVQQNQARNVGAKSKILVTRSRNAVTLFRVSGPRLTQGAPPVQVILRPCKSILELLLNFDIDSCCFAWELDANRVVCTPRGLRALRFGCNVADTRFAGGGYCRRLEKYACRGFGIGVPGYMPSLVRAGLFTASYIYLEQYGLLLDVGRKYPHGREMTFSIAHFDGLHAGTPEEVTIKVGALQHGRAVRNMHRLVVLDRKDVYVAHVGRPPKGRGSTAKATRCTPVKGSQDGFTLLWHTDDKHLEGKESAEEIEDGSEDYDPAPLAFVERLLEKRFQNELELSSEGCGERGEAWLTGGGMRRLTDAMSKQHISCAYKLVSDTQASRLHSQVPLLFVYDFVTCEASFDKLRFVRDAGRLPLTSVLCEKHFMDIFGLPRKLSFDVQHNYASRSPIKWWEGVY